MDVNTLEIGLEKHLPVIEDFLKTILLKKINVEISATSMADDEMVIEALKTGTAVIGMREQAFDSDVYMAFDNNWIPQLSMAMLGVEEHEVNEITRDLIKEFSSQLFGTLQTSLQNEELPVEPGDVQLLKSAQIANSVDHDEYFMAQIDVTGKFMIDGDEQPQLAIILAFGIPDEDRVNEVLGLEAKPEPEPEPEEEETTADDNNEEPVSDDDIEAMMSGGGSDEDSDDEESQKSAPQKEKQQPQKQKQKQSSSAEAGVEAMKRDQQKAREESKKKPPVRGTGVEFDDFSPSSDTKSDIEIRNLDILKDVELDISVELGRKELPLGDVLHLVRGSVIELDKLAGEPVEIYANGHRIAEGEVVVIDEHFGVRITNLVSTRERIESLR
jgi:flagellar motor switch protein FliN/FliY